MKKRPPRDEDSAAPYEVGYRKPPKHSRFQPGRSGNPKGRPRGTKNLRTDFAEELAEKIVVREGEKIQRVSKQRAMVMALVNRGLQGDTRAANVVLSRKERFDSDAESENGQPTTFADLIRLADLPDDE